MRYYPLLGAHIDINDRDAHAEDYGIFPNVEDCPKCGGRFVSAKVGDACLCQKCRWCATWVLPGLSHECDGDSLY